MAPPMAADVLNLPPFTVAELVAEVTFPAGIDTGLVETVGGVRSPVAADGDSIDLLVALQPDAVVLVAHAGLGTINEVSLAVDALARATAAPVEVVLNLFDPGGDLHIRNRHWLSARVGLHVTTEPDVR